LLLDDGKILQAVFVIVSDMKILDVGFRNLHLKVNDTLPRPITILILVVDIVLKSVLGLRVNRRGRLLGLVLLEKKYRHLARRVDVLVLVLVDNPTGTLNVVLHIEQGFVADGRKHLRLALDWRGELRGRIHLRLVRSVLEVDRTARSRVVRRARVGDDVGKLSGLLDG
jgi:hypothetical protein